MHEKTLLCLSNEMFLNIMLFCSNNTLSNLAIVCKILNYWVNQIPIYYPKHFPEYQLNRFLIPKLLKDDINEESLRLMLYKKIYTSSRCLIQTFLTKTFTENNNPKQKDIIEYQLNRFLIPKLLKDEIHEIDIQAVLSKKIPESCKCFIQMFREIKKFIENNSSENALGLAYILVKLSSGKQQTLAISLLSHIAISIKNFSARLGKSGKKNEFNKDACDMTLDKCWSGLKSTYISDCFSTMVASHVFKDKVVKNITNTLKTLGRNKELAQSIEPLVVCFLIPLFPIEDVKHIFNTHYDALERNIFIQPKYQTFLFMCMSTLCSHLPKKYVKKFFFQQFPLLDSDISNQRATAALVTGALSQQLDQKNTTDALYKLLNLLHDSSALVAQLAYPAIQAMCSNLYMEDIIKHIFDQQFSLLESDDKNEQIGAAKTIGALSFGISPKDAIKAFHKLLTIFKDADDGFVSDLYIAINNLIPCYCFSEEDINDKFKQRLYQLLDNKNDVTRLTSAIYIISALSLILPAKDISKIIFSKLLPLLKHADKAVPTAIILAFETLFPCLSEKDAKKVSDELCSMLNESSVEDEAGEAIGTLVRYFPKVCELQEVAKKFVQQWKTTDVWSSVFVKNGSHITTSQEEAKKSIFYIALRFMSINGNNIKNNLYKTLYATIKAIFQELHICLPTSNHEIINHVERTENNKNKKLKELCLCFLEIIDKKYHLKPDNIRQILGNIQELKEEYPNLVKCCVTYFKFFSRQIKSELGKCLQCLEEELKRELNQLIHQKEQTKFAAIPEVSIGSAK